MAPQEVAGLQALAKAHGGSLTINPDTGLPEAGFLSSILPMVVGAGLMAATGGAATPLIAGMSNAALIGLGTGAVTGLATGSLSKGLMAGLGAYGGAGLAGGVMGAGAAGAGAGAGMSALDAGMGVMPTGTIGAAQTLAPSALDAGMNVYPGVATSSASPSFYDAMGHVGNPAAGGQLANAIPPTQAGAMVPTTVTAPVTPPAPVAVAPTPEPSFFNKFLGKAASKGVEETGVGGLSGLLKYGGAAAAPLLMSSMDSSAGSALPAANKLRPYEYTYNPGRVANPQAGYTGAESGQRTYFNPTFTRTAAAGGMTSDMPMNSSYASGGISTLGGYSDGGQLLRGPGDGVSDSIPADIGGKQPARLADGEFVVPSRIVSELGNGSTEAGAKQLYAMIARVQNARKKSMGKDKVATNSKAANLLPA